VPRPRTLSLFSLEQSLPPSIAVALHPTLYRPSCPSPDGLLHRPPPPFTHPPPRQPPCPLPCHSPCRPLGSSTGHCALQHGPAPMLGPPHPCPVQLSPWPTRLGCAWLAPPRPTLAPNSSSPDATASIVSLPDTRQMPPPR
jgi:hypothetical protein